MMEGFSEIMTIEETAKYLKIGKSTLYKMAREGKIPAVKIMFGKKESEIEVEYIQELLGHKNPKAMKTYTHLSTKSLSAVRNHLDNLLARGEA